jgi:hypothetical protein
MQKWSSMNIGYSIAESIPEEADGKELNLITDFGNEFLEQDIKENKEEKEVIVNILKNNVAEQYLMQRKELTLDGFIAGRVGRCNSMSDFYDMIDLENLIDNAPKQAGAQVHNIDVSAAQAVVDKKEDGNESPKKARLEYTPSDFDIVNNYEGEITIYNEILAASHV